MQLKTIHQLGWSVGTSNAKTGAVSASCVHYENTFRNAQTLFMRPFKGAPWISLQQLIVKPMKSTSKTSRCRFLEVRRQRLRVHLAREQAPYLRGLRPPTGRNSWSSDAVTHSWNAFRIPMCTTNAHYPFAIVLQGPFLLQMPFTLP